MLAVLPILRADEPVPSPVSQRDAAIAAVLEAAPVISSQTERVVREEPAPLPGMIPVRKEVEATVQRISDPGIPDPPVKPPLVQSAETIARLKALAALRPRRVFVHLSATVYDHKRTHLRWYHGGAPDRKMEAWSSLDFTEFSWVQKVVRDGVEYEFMGIGMGVEDTTHRRRIAERLGRIYKETVFPELPEPGTPFFVVTKGDAGDAAALAPITALHELYQTDGPRLRAEKIAREKANAEREAWIRAHPPEPQDVLIRVWKTAQPEAIVAPLGDGPVTQP